MTFINAYIYTAEDSPIENGFLVIEDGKIAAVGEMADYSGTDESGDYSGTIRA